MSQSYQNYIAGEFRGTDEAIEVRNPATDEEFGVHRLQSVIRRRSGCPAAEIVRAVFAAVERFSRLTTPEDDQTLVVVRRPQAPDSDDGTQDPRPASSRS